MYYLFALSYGRRVTSYLSFCLDFSEMMDYNLELQDHQLFFPQLPLARVLYPINKNENMRKPLVSL